MSLFAMAIKTVVNALATLAAFALLIAAPAAAQDHALRGLKLGMSLDEATKSARLDTSADLIGVGRPGELFRRFTPLDGVHALRPGYFPFFTGKDDKPGEDVLMAHIFPPRYAGLSQELARYKDKLVVVTWQRMLAETDKAKLVAYLASAYGPVDAEHAGPERPQDATYHLLVWGAKLVPNRSNDDVPTLYLVDSHRILLAEIVIPSPANTDRRLGLILEAVDYDAIEHADTILKILNDRD